MRSINIKRAAVVAAGAAMIMGAFSPALATVGPDQATVTSLVNTIKSNLTDTQVVIGSTSKASDSVQGAKIAAVLATLNYQPTTVQATGDASVEVTTTAGITPGLTAGDYKFKQLGDLNAAPAKTKTIDSQVMPDLFKSHELITTAKIGTSEDTKTIRYEDNLAINGNKLTTKYDEKTDSYGTYTDVDKGALIYTVDFTKGDALNMSSSITYSPLPKINILGKTYTLDTKASSKTKLVFYAGGQYTFSDTNKEQTVDDYQVTSDFISEKQETITVTKGDLSETATINEGSYHDFFAGTDDKFTVHVDSTQTNGNAGFSMVTMGAGKLELKQGKTYPEDDRWKVSIETDTSGDVLKNLKLTFDKHLKTTSTTNPAIEMGTYFDGPKRLDGTVPFQLGIAGYSEADTTPVKFEAGEDNKIIKATWESRDGETQTLDATADEVNIPTSTTDANVTIGDDTPYTIVNNKVVKYEGYTGTNDNYVEFTIDGNDYNFKLNGSGQTTLDYNVANGDSITCNITADSNSTPTQVTIDNNPNTCDITPDAVKIGNSVVFDSEPTLNLTGIKDPTPLAIVNTPVYSAYNGLNTSNTSQVLRVISQRMPIYIFLDNETTSDSSTGLYAKTLSPTFKVSADNSTIVTGSWNKIPIVDLSKSTINEDDKYQILTNNTVSNGEGYYAATVDGSDGETITVTVPEKARDYILDLKGAATETTTTAGTQTVKEGDTVSGVTINKINYPSVTEGTYYTQVASGLQPQDLVVLDDQATATYKIVVGGPFVNTIAAGMSIADQVKEIGSQYVYAEGNNLLVAGYKATDTAAATNELISLLTA